MPPKNKNYTLSDFSNKYQTAQRKQRAAPIGTPPKQTTLHPNKLAELHQQEKTLHEAASSKFGRDMGQMHLERYGVEPDASLNQPDAHKAPPIPQRNPLKPAKEAPKVATIDPLAESKARKTARTEKKAAKAPKASAPTPAAPETPKIDYSPGNYSPSSLPASNRAFNTVTPQQKTAAKARAVKRSVETGMNTGQGYGYEYKRLPNNQGGPQDIAVRSDSRPRGATESNPDYNRSVSAGLHKPHEAEAHEPAPASVIAPKSANDSDDEEYRTPIHRVRQADIDISAIPRVGGVVTRQEHERNMAAPWRRGSAPRGNDNPTEPGRAPEVEHKENPNVSGAQFTPANYLGSDLHKRDLEVTSKPETSSAPRPRGIKYAAQPSRGNRAVQPVKDTTGPRPVRPGGPTRPPAGPPGRNSATEPRRASNADLNVSPGRAILRGSLAVGSEPARLVKEGVTKGAKFVGKALKETTKGDVNAVRLAAHVVADRGLRDVASRGGNVQPKKSTVAGKLGARARSEYQVSQTAKAAKPPHEIGHKGIEWGKPGTIMAKDYSPKRNISDQQFGSAS